MLELDDMERSSAKHDPLLFFILLVTGFRIIQALTGEFSRARFVMSWDASQFGAEMPPPWPFPKLLSFPPYEQEDTSPPAVTLYMVFVW